MKITRINGFEIQSVLVPKEYYIQVSTGLNEIKKLSKQVKDTKNLVAKKSKLESREIKKWKENFAKIDENIQILSKILLN